MLDYLQYWFFTVKMRGGSRYYSGKNMAGFDTTVLQVVVWAGIEKLNMACQDLNIATSYDLSCVAKAQNRMSHCEKCGLHIQFKASPWVSVKRLWQDFGATVSENTFFGKVLGSGLEQTVQLTGLGELKNEQTFNLHFKRLVQCMSCNHSINKDVRRWSTG